MATEDPGLKKEIITLVEDTARELTDILDVGNKQGERLLIQICWVGSITLSEF